ncbi:MAG: ROK family protein [Desulfobacca sp.]|nr:ROK family protein [Desulfobacca sp.]
MRSLIRELKKKTAVPTHPTNIIGIDLGGTRTKIGLIDGQGRILLFTSFSTRLDLGREHSLRRLVRHLDQFIKTSKQKGAVPDLIGLGAPGSIDRQEGIIRHSPNFPDWQEVPMARIIIEKFGLPTFVDNDANVVPYGEKWVGAGKDLNHFVCITLGTGLGSGLILNGRPWYGCQGNGPEFGHITIQPRGRRCGCGNRGCLETLASATYLVKRAQKGLDNRVSPLLAELLSKKSQPLSSKIIYQAARQGDLFCISLYAEMGQFLGIALANLVHILGLEGVILGGGVSKASTIFLPYLKKEFNKRLTMIAPEKISIRVSFLGDKSGILGAAKMALDRHRDRLIKP